MLEGVGLEGEPGEPLETETDRETDRQADRHGGGGGELQLERKEEAKIGLVEEEV